MAIKKRKNQMVDVDSPHSIDSETRSLYEDLEIEDHLASVLASGADVDTVTALVQSLLERRRRPKVYNIFSEPKLERLRDRIDLIPELVAGRIEEMLVDPPSQTSTPPSEGRKSSPASGSSGSDSQPADGNEEGQVPITLVEELNELFDELRTTREEILKSLETARETAKRNRKGIEAAKSRLERVESADQE